MMKRKQIILLVTAAIALNGAPIWAQSGGGNKSESDTRLPQGEPSQAGKGPGTKDTSIGGSQSKRSGESQTPLPEGSKAGRSSRDMSQSSGTSGQQEIRQVQEALKNQGHDPGPVDGVMGPQTRQALRAFQSSNGLKQTGMLDPETKQKLNIENSSGRATPGGTR
jgi:peptidoglycan hydrolase-like protein with peptidoglycan-binding domain